MMKKMALVLLAIAGIWLLWPSPSNGLTPEQVEALKKAGVEDKTIRLMIRQEEAAKEKGGKEMGVAEIQDRDGHAVTVYSTGPSAPPLSDTERERVERAWEMLRHIIIDGRR